MKIVECVERTRSHGWPWRKFVSISTHHLCSCSQNLTRTDKIGLVTIRNACNVQLLSFFSLSFVCRNYQKFVNVGNIGVEISYCRNRATYSDRCRTSLNSAKTF